MDKVKLPKEVAEAIKTILAAGMVKHALYDRTWIEGEVDDTPAIRNAKNTILDYIDFNADRFEADNQLVRYYSALVNGYEVEETPEDKVRAIYNLWNEWEGNDGHFSSQSIASIIIDVVEALGHKIEGVNA